MSSVRPNQMPKTSIKNTAGRSTLQATPLHAPSQRPPRPFPATATPLPSDASPHTQPRLSCLLPHRQRPSQRRGLTGPKASVHPTATSCRASDFQHQSEQNSAKLYFHNPIIPPHFSITRISGRYAAFILVLSEKVPTPQKCPRSAASRSMHPPNS